MHYFLYPTKDTYVTNDPTYMNKNMGLDEIMQLDKVMSQYSCASEFVYSELIGYTSSSVELLSGSMSASYNSGSTDTRVVSSSYVNVPGGITPGSVLSRPLLQFDVSTVSQSYASGRMGTGSFECFLNLKICQSVESAVEYTIVAYPLAAPWVMGTGYRYDGAVTADGTTWKFSDVNGNKWAGPSGSLTDCSGGGIWYASGSIIESGSSVPRIGGYACSQSFNYESSDVSMDVTNIVKAWMSGSIPNYGLILMHADQSSSIDYGSLKFFSKETNTVYSPYIDVAWDDFRFVPTGSAGEITIDDAVVNIKNMNDEYKFGSIVRFNVTSRQRYPVKTFTNRLSDYLTPYYLPTSSFYCIKDAESEMEIIPYDNYTKLSVDAKGNYFMLDTTGLPQERYFKVEIRTEQDGAILTYPIPTAFKISR